MTENLAKAANLIEVHDMKKIYGEGASTVEALKEEMGELVTLATRKLALGMDEASQKDLVKKAIKDIGNA